MARRGAAIHELNAWLSGAIRGGLLDDLPPYTPEPGRLPVPAAEFARRLVADLNGPTAGGEPIGQIEARAFPFRIWVERQIGDLDQRPNVRRSGTRLPGDPARRGLNIGRSLHLISKNVAAPPTAEDLAPPVDQPADRAEAGISLRILATLFLVPIGAILAVELGRRYPQVLICGLGLTVAAAFLYWAARSVSADDENPNENKPGNDVRRAGMGPGRDDREH